MDTPRATLPELTLPAARLERTRRFWAAVLLLPLFAAIGWHLWADGLFSRGRLETVSIAERSWVVVESATTREARARGLSFRPSLDPGAGMLFVFDQPEQAGFWMKDMQFPLDIIFIRGGAVDSVALARQPGDLVPAYPMGAIDRVFEVNAGEAQGIEPGDPVSFRPAFSWKKLIGGN